MLVRVSGGLTPEADTYSAVIEERGGLMKTDKKGAKGSVVLDGGANAAVLTELGGLGASLVAALLVIVRVDSVLFEYVGAASAARLERIGEKEEGRGAA